MKMEVIGYSEGVTVLSRNSGRVFKKIKFSWNTETRKAADIGTEKSRGLILSFLGW